MYHYLFTNDLRVSVLETTLIDVAKMHIQGTVPSAKDDKGTNNNALTLGFYFNLMNRSNCAYAAANGNVRRVVLNFVKKFQFPNLRTTKSFEEAKNDGIRLTPMRTILKLLYTIYMNEGNNGWLTTDEIKEFIFYNDAVAKNSEPNLIDVYSQIKEFRINGQKPNSIASESNRAWKQDDRQIREMIKVLLWSGCVVESERGKYRIEHSSLSTADKVDVFEVITNNDFWDGDNKEEYFKYMDMRSLEEERRMEQQSKKMDRTFLRNRIIFGAPGTGKSYSLNKQIKEIIPCDDEGQVIEEYFERVTFYPSYTYSQFVGTYKPKPKKFLEVDQNGNQVEKEFISYEFVPGPFARILLKALKLKQEGRTENCMLVIEEINRANAAAVFGDVFQLLDRKSDGNSEYAIETSEEMRSFLARELGKVEKECAKIILPSNLFIWATMNSADQGVMPMDTAFKRRWDFEYIGINDGEFACSYLNAPIQIGSITTSWNKIRKEINRLLQSPNIRLSEDKLMGPFFLAESAFIEDKNEEAIEETQESSDIKENEDTTLDNSNVIISVLDEKIFKAAFKSKILMYLFEDAVKSKKTQLFDSVTYSQLCEDFELEGLKVFKGLIEENLIINTSVLDEPDSKNETSDND